MSEQYQTEADPRVLGLRIQDARKARGLTQQQVAEALEVSRPTYLAVEKGDRLPRPGELIRLAKLLGRSVHELLRRHEPVQDFANYFHLRASPTKNPEAAKAPLEAARQLQQLCDGYLDLEEKCGSTLQRNYPAVYETSGRDATEAGKQIAADERNRLGLGDGPVSNLRELLETDVGLRVFYLDMPSHIAGLFVYTERLGGCIAIQKKHPQGRRIWSLGHEYAHFLAHRYEADATVLPTRTQGSEKERFAESFTAAFLMPDNGLRRRFYTLQRETGQITPANLLVLADRYGVSFEAILLRLEELRLLPVGTWDDLKQEGFKVGEARDLLGLSGATEEHWLPRRYLNLAAQAHEQDLLTGAELMGLLHTDREEALRTVAQLATRSVVTNDGAPIQLRFDFAEPLGRTRG